MSFTTIFTIIMSLVILRILWLRLKAANSHSENFKQLPPKDQLAVLKECLLNNPTETNLQNLKDFSQREKLNIDTESYRPFLKKQLELSKKKDALAEDNELFSQEALWMDRIRPLEFTEAEAARTESNTENYIVRTLEGISRLYSDEAILAELKKIENDYPKSATLSKNYVQLMELREQSLADDESLKKLRQAKTAWEEDLLHYEP